MKPEDEKVIVENFSAVIDTQVGEESKGNSENALPKTGAFLISNTAYDHEVTIGTTSVKYPTYFVASFNATAHHVSVNTLEEKSIYEENHTIKRRVVKDFDPQQWENLKIVFEKPDVCIVFDPQKGDYTKRRTSLYHCEQMSPEERELADVVRKAWESKHPKKA